jgi:hypothetical protein
MVLLNAFVKIRTINFLMDMDKSTMHLNSTMSKGIRKLQIFTLHKMLWRTTIYQNSIPMFNLKISVGLKIPIRCTLNIASTLEYRWLGRMVVHHVDKVLEEDLHNHKRKDLRFCVAMHPKKDGYLQLVWQKEEMKMSFHFKKYPI